MRPYVQSLKKRSAVALTAMSLSLILAAGQPQSPDLVEGSGAPAAASAVPAASGGPPGAADIIAAPPAAARPAADDQQPAIPAELTSFYNQELTWANCDDGSIATCATLTVPLDYNAPDGQTITLALKRVRAADGNAEKGTLFTNPGGPGNSGVGSVEGTARSLATKVRGQYDIIGFDPRGVGQSEPLSCAGQNAGNGDAAPVQQGGINDEQPADAAAVQGENPDDGAADEDDLTPWADAQATDAATFESRGAAVSANCAQNSSVPEILDHMDTATAARDMDVMRGVMGDSKLNYLGVSYGTYLGATYLDLFPTRGGRIILDSAMDPSISRAQIHADNMEHNENALRSYVDSCLAGTAGDGCPLSGTSDEAMAQLQTFLEGLDDKPLPMTANNGRETTLGHAQAQTYIRFISNRRQEYWSYLTSALAQAMNDGNGTMLYQNYQKVATAYDNAATSPPVARTQNSNYAFYGVHCTDYPDTGDAASWNAQADNLKKSYPISYDAASAYTDAFCHGWGHTTTSTQPHRVTGQGSDTVVVIGNTADPQTPYSWATSLADQLENSRLLTVNDAIHGAVNRNSCASDAVSTFLLDGTPPEEGATCQANPLEPVKD